MEYRGIFGFKALSRKVDIYKDEIISRNYNNFKSFAFGGTVLTGVITLVSVIFYGSLLYTREYAILFLLFVLCSIYMRLFLKNHIKYTLVSFYAVVIPVLAVGILMGTFLDPESNAMTIMILLCTLFMFITDKPCKIIGCIVGTSIVFLICSFLCKSTELFVSDAVNLAIYLSIGIGVNMLTLKDRIESAENRALAERKAKVDALTSILNRGAGDEIVKNMLSQGRKGAFIIADIDNFKKINDTCGHQTGDEIIREVSWKIKGAFRDNDVVWRLGGDEFAVFAVDLTSRELCERRLIQLRDAVSEISATGSASIEVRLSVGCSICGSNGCEFDDAYKSSDNALYGVKQGGKNGYAICEI